MRVFDLKPQQQESVPVSQAGQLVETGNYIGISLYDAYHDAIMGKYRIISLKGNLTWSYSSWEQAGLTWKVRQHGVTLENG